MPFSNKYWVDRLFDIRKLNYEWSTDTIDGKMNSIHGNQYAQIFGRKEFFVKYIHREQSLMQVAC